MEPADASQHDREDWLQDFTGSMPAVGALGQSAVDASSAVPSRVNQLDAQSLDQELTTLLREQFLSLFRHLRPSLVGELEPELTAVLTLLIFSGTVLSGRPTPGMQLMNLDFASPSTHGAPRVGLTRPQRLAYTWLFIGLHYAWRRAGHLVADAQRRPRTSPQLQALDGGMRWMQSAFRGVAVLYFLRFIRGGPHRDVLEGALGIQLRPGDPSLVRAVSYEYMNRQLMWQSLSEFLTFLLPLIDVHSVKRFVRRQLSGLPRIQQAGLLGPHPAAGGQSCGLCAGMMVVPYIARPCRHPFCYYCIRAQTEADPQCGCPTCGMRIVALQRRPSLA